jgi:hypothetical protein
MVWGLLTMPPTRGVPSIVETRLIWCGFNSGFLFFSKDNKIWL